MSASATVWRGHGISSLGDIEFPQRLETLDLRDNAVVELGIIRPLATLRSVYLGRNLVLDAGPLLSLHQLVVLDLSDNRLKNVQLSGLTALRTLNLAGNGILGVEGIAGLEACHSLTALDLSRNFIVSVEALTQRLKLLPLKVFSLLGNPGVDGRGPSADLQHLVVYNARVLLGRASEASELRRSIPLESGILWKSETEATSGETHLSASEGASAFAASAVGRSEVEAATSPRDSAADREGAQVAERPLPILDSADDMTSEGRTPFSSVSEFGNHYSQGPLAAESPPALPLVERQDSANYQPRPPALAERQDSAQNLQALAEAEAELGAIGAPAEPPILGLARQDSARELDGSGRSPSPASRQGLPTGSGTTQRQAVGSPRAAVSPRQDSASEHEGLQRPLTSELLMQSPQQVLEPCDLRASGSSPRRGSEAMEARSSQEAGMGSPAASLEAARLLHQSAGASRLEQPAKLFSPFRNVELGSPVRQDSALDSLSEARRAVLADIPRADSVPLPTSDPLQQARHLVQMSSVPLSRHSSPPPPQPTDHLNWQDASGSLLRARQSCLGPDSPFLERPITPLSPQWTASQLQPSFSQQLPRISSGFPWTPSGGSLHRLSGEDEQLAALMESSLAADGNLLAEARRIVLGNPETSRDAASTAGKRSALPSLVELPVPENGLESTQAAAGLPQSRSGESCRDTPYPDSPLAAGADGSLRDPTFFHRSGLQSTAATENATGATGQGASRNAAFSGDVAESSQAAARRGHL